MFGHVITAVTVCSIVLLSFVLLTTNPVESGPFGILLVFLFSYTSLIGIVTFLLYQGSRLVSYLAKSLGVRKPWQRVSLKRSYYFSTIIALAPVMLVGIQSVGGITVYEVSLVGLFLAVGILYIAKRV